MNFTGSVPKSIVRTLMLVSLFALPSTKAWSQNRGLGIQQQNQQGGIGRGTQGAFGQGQSRANQFGGRAGGGLGGQGGGFGQSQPTGGQDGFIGTDAQQMRNQRSNNRLQRQGLIDFAIESFNTMREARRGGGARQNTKPLVRMKLKPLFRSPSVSASELTVRAQAQLGRMLPAESSTAIAHQVSVHNGVATIQGVVKSDYEKQLATKMLAIQPGILRVENQLTVESDQAGLLLSPPQ